MPTINTESEKKETKYKTLLNNLLEINGRDQAIFTKVNGVDSFDITTKFGVETSNKILSQKDFSLRIEEQDLDELLSTVEDANTADEIISAYEKYKVKLFSTKKIALLKPSTFKETKKELVEKLELDIQKSKNRWMEFNRKAIDMNIQENIWPLHIATMFISIVTNKKTIYAPLLFREVQLSFENSKISIKNYSDWKPNEKVLFLLKEEGFEVNEEATFNDMHFDEVSQEIINWFDYEGEFDLIEEFNSFKMEDIKNKQIKFHSGVVLGLFKPSGGHLRKTLIKIIDNDEIDEILDVDADKTVYKDKLDDFLVNNSDKLLRIQKSNYSQDKALASALIQDTIIWGPPGTGKSQVIANIIANILNGNKSAVVMSQKKAALDVLKQRLGNLAPFVLFVLNDNKMKKEEFYKPLQKFVELIEMQNYAPKINGQKLITKEQIDLLNDISEAKNSNLFDPSIEIIKMLGANFNQVIDFAFELNGELKYPKNAFEQKPFIKETAYINGVVKKGFIFKRYPNLFHKNVVQAFKFKYQTQVDLNMLTENISKTNLEKTKSLKKASELLTKNSAANIDTDYLVSKMASMHNNWIKNQKVSDRPKYDSYVKFANAVRAGRALPYKFVNAHIEIIRELFKIIITTPESSFVNWEKHSFDYAILDESSQMFLETGLPILYLAKIKILAGDLEQMQPSRWFSTRDNNEDGEEEYAERAESLLQYASDKGVFNVMLNQNFRSSSASLMSFSSKHFYNSELEVIDKISGLENESFEVINVKGKWEESTNMIEAKKVIEIAMENLQSYDKIIILTFNIKQRQLIEKLIIENHPKLLEAISEESLMIRNIENIQGDEADLVIASLVYDPTTSMGSSYVTRSGGKNALNVAVSRAKEKMIVVKSVTAETIKSANSEDFKIFKQWLSFLDKNEIEKKVYSLGQNEIEESFGETDSQFERDVIDEIKRNIKTKINISLIKQYEVGSKRIDIALIDSETKKFVLGIEVDGYKYHGGMGFDKWLEDYSRQEFLEAKGYNIFRVTEIEWKLDKNSVLNKISSLIN